MSGACDAQTAYPTRPIRIVVPYPPGGGNDIVGRFIAEDLAPRLGQQVIVDNRSGGSTVVGAEIAARAPADGYTLLVTSHTTLAILPNLRAKLPYDPVRSFEPVAWLASQTFALVVHPSLPVRTVKEMLALARLRPGQLTFSSAGSGTGTHLSGEQFKVLGRVDLLHVPYRGGNSAITAVIGGEATMTFGSFSAVSPFVPSGRLRLIGVTSAQRSSLAPQVPTVAESGSPGYEMTLWYALLAPRGVPQAVIDRLAAEVAASLQSAGMRERLAQVGYEPEGGGPERLASRIREETVRYGKLTKAIGFREE